MEVSGIRSGSNGITEKQATEESTKLDAESDGADSKGMVTMRIAFSCTCHPKVKATADPNLSCVFVPLAW